MATGLDGEAEALAAVLFAGLVHGVEDAVGGEDDEVAGLEIGVEFLVDAGLEEADGDAFGIEVEEDVAAADDGREAAGIGDGELAGGRIPEEGGEGDVLGFGAAFGEFHYLEDLARNRVYRFTYMGVTNRVKGAAAGFALRPLALE